MNIEVNVSNKIARLADRSVVGVCGNSDYVIQFNFDSEWDAMYTARKAWLHPLPKGCNAQNGVTRRYRAM